MCMQCIFEFRRLQLAARIRLELNSHCPVAKQGDVCALPRNIGGLPMFVHSTQARDGFFPCDDELRDSSTTCSRCSREACREAVHKRQLGLHIQLDFILRFHLSRIQWILFAPLQCNIRKPRALPWVTVVGITLSNSADARYSVAKDVDGDFFSREY